MTKARGRRTSPFPSFPRRRETRYTGSQEEAKEAGGFRAECVSDGSFLRRRIQLFIAYLYKPEAQAKVFKMPVLHSPIIPSLALQACQTRDTVKSRFPHPPLDKKRVPELAEGDLKATVADAYGSERYLPTWHYLQGESERFQESLVSSFKVVCRTVPSVNGIKIELSAP